MHELERRRLILRLLAERGSVSLQQLVDLLGASEPTVRRDLTRLEKEGLLARVHGGARPVSGKRAKKTLEGQQPFESTLLQYGEYKRRIGREAARLVTPGESIIVTGGSTTFALIEQLGDRNLQVLTTSLPHAEYLVRYTNNRVVLPAGEVIREQGVILSPFDQEAFPHYYARKLFLGAQAMGPLGLMQTDPTLVRADQRLVEQADEVIALVDSSKFAASGTLVSCPLAKVKRLVTDERVDRAVIDKLRSAGVAVTIARAAGGKPVAVKGVA
jgi:DeoR family ulaG and ulaABCDEF operon transcriptional repressor